MRVPGEALTVRYRALDPWEVDASGLPDDAPVDDRLRFALRWAVLAPSGHNTQPWWFRLDRGRAEVLADRSRRLPVVDPDDRELTISVAAAAATLETALRGLGSVPVAEWLPEPTDPDLVARVGVAGLAPAEPRLLDTITRRRTNRGPFGPAAIPEDVVGAIERQAADVGVDAIVVTGDARAALGELVAEGDRIQMADRAFRRELARWVRPNRTRRADGMRGYGFGRGDLASVLGPLVVRTLDLGRGQAGRDEALAAGAPALVVLATDGDDPPAWVRVGRALTGLLLALTGAGWAASHLNQPIEVPALRRRVADAVGRDAAPQLLLRIGRPLVDAVPAPRMPAEQRMR